MAALSSIFRAMWACFRENIGLVFPASLSLRSTAWQSLARTRCAGISPVGPPAGFFVSGSR